ncbi:MAG TPA: peptidase M16 [Clostridiales bacterium]|nr:peptidase M16 [Clostridiales bacterium]
MIKKYTLNNGLRIVAEKIDYVKSVSFGIWVKVGSTNENDNTNGMSHFIEHMLFKGTKNRSANQIAEDTDNIGGQMNAFTSKDCTCFYIKVLDENLDAAVDILSDMFFNSTFAEEEIEKEISVVIEEIKMYEDSPEDVVHDKLSETVFKNSPLAYPILGTIDNLKSYTRERVLAYKEEQYTPERTVISITGNFDEDYLIKLLEDKFGKWENKQGLSEILDSDHNRNIIGVNKELEQLHVCMGTKTIGRHDDLYYPLMIMNNLFGGTMSSRIFQEIREKRGLVYSIYSFTSNYAENGLFGIYAGLAYENLEEAIKTILVEMDKMKEAKITEEEFNRAKQQIKSNFILGLESTSSRMSSIGRRELLYNEIITPDEIVDKINAVQLEDIIKISKMIFNKENFTVVYTGNLKKHKELQVILEKLLN